MCDEKEKHDQAAAWSNTSFLSLAIALMLLPVTILTEDAQSFFSVFTVCSCQFLFCEVRLWRNCCCMPVTMSEHKAEIPKVLGGNLSHLIYINPNLTYSADVLFNPFPVTEKKKKKKSVMSVIANISSFWNFKV